MILLKNIKLELEEELYFACKQDIGIIIKDLKSESVFSYAILGNSGFDSLGSCACTRKRLESYTHELFEQGLTQKKACLIAESSSDLWDYLNKNSQFFRSVNKLIEKVQDAFYDGEIEDITDDTTDLDDFFFDISVQVLSKLKDDNIFKNKPFEIDMLLGIQFSDPTDGAKKYILHSVEKLSSENWYQKMLEAYSS